MVIELLSSLGGTGARTLVEIGEKPLVEELTSHPDALRIGWPTQTLTVLAGVAYRCVYPYANRRSTVTAELPALETALA